MNDVNRLHLVVKHHPLVPSSFEEGEVTVQSKQFIPHPRMRRGLGGGRRGGFMYHVVRVPPQIVIDRFLFLEPGGVGVPYALNPFNRFIISLKLFLATANTFEPSPPNDRMHLVFQSNILKTQLLP
jgi:hypothetical protein